MVRCNEKAHHLGMKSTATMMIGSVENIHHRLYHLEKFDNYKRKLEVFVHL